MISLFIMIALLLELDLDSYKMLIVSILMLISYYEGRKN